MISIILPFFNEERNLQKLYSELEEYLNRQKKDFELIFIDDGSIDQSRYVVQKIASSDPHVRLVALNKRSGKGKALDRGIEEAKGDIIVFMDADLQDDPSYLSKFLAKLDEGYDFVNGVRKNRKDKALIKLYTYVVNGLLHKVLKSPYSDINCGFKAFKRRVAEEAIFYGNNFRFFPLAVYLNGYKVTEIPVENRPRYSGKSKFGVSKLFVGIFDTLTAYFLFKFAERPLHFFGSIGALFFGAGFLWALYLSYERLFHGVLLYRRPALQFAVLLIIVGLQILMTGFIGELIVYLHKKQERS